VPVAKSAVGDVAARPKAQKAIEAAPKGPSKATARRREQRKKEDERRVARQVEERLAEEKKRWEEEEKKKKEEEEERIALADAMQTIDTLMAQTEEEFAAAAAQAAEPVAETAATRAAARAAADAEARVVAETAARDEGLPAFWAGKVVARLPPKQD
jgi:hypothetical protein